MQTNKTQRSGLQSLHKAGNSAVHRLKNMATTSHGNYIVCKTKKI